MNDFITLACPTCGGRLKIEKNASSYICDYCGQSHLLRREDIESYGRCPICQRNDRVEKVTAILNREDPLARKIFIPLPHPDEVMVYNPKPEPEFDEKIKLHDLTDPLIKFIALGLPGLMLLIAGITRETIFWKLILISAALFMIYKGALGGFQAYTFYTENKRLSAEKAQERLAWEKEVQDWVTYKEDFDRVFFDTKVRIKDAYERAVSRYELMYYCHRDDCVFIPGEGTHARLADIQEYLFQVSE